MIRALKLAAFAVLFAGAASAQQTDFSKVEIKTHDLGNKTYMLEGQGGNITIAVADDGIFMVDTQFAPLHDKIKAAIEAISKQPIKYLINTHIHGDHTGGNEAFAKDGATIVATGNLKSRLEVGFSNGLTGAKTPPTPAGGLPTRTYTDKLTLELKGRKAELAHLPKAHTDGDTYVWFADANVLSTGDIVSVGNRYPNIDFANGGGIDGLIAGVERYISLANDNTKVVPGHGAVLKKADLVAYRDILKAARDRVAKAIAEGKSEEDLVNAKPFTDLDAKSGANEVGSATFVRVIYRSLKPS